MPVIEIELVVHAPVERVFDLSRSVELHVESTAPTGERAVAGVTTGMLELDDQVTWEARHLGFTRRLTSRITELDRPRHFRDSMVSGAFRRFDHDHDFSAIDSGTLMRDRFDFDSPLGPLGTIANALFLKRYLTAFLEKRAQAIKQVAESERWKLYTSRAGH